MGFSSTLKSALDSAFGALAGGTRQGATDALEAALSAGAFTAIGSAGAPGFQNSWVNFNAPIYCPGGFMKDALGFVHLQGLLKDGSGLIFVLPSGFCPLATLEFCVVGGSGNARVEITSAGNIQVVGYNAGGSNIYLSLDGINFKAGV